MDKKKIDKELNKTFANIKDYLTLKKGLLFTYFN